MSTKRVYTLGLVAAFCLSFVWVAVAQNKRAAPVARVDGKDVALRDLARLVTVHEVHKLHWKILETMQEFRQVIDQLSEELVPEELTLQWKVNIIPAGKVNEQDVALDEFERLAVAAIQGGQDEASLIGGDPIVRYARAVRAKTSCLVCHQGKEGGQVIGIVSLKMHSRDEKP